MSGQSVVGCSLEYSGLVVGVYVSAHHHISVTEIRVDVGCGLITVCCYYNGYTCRHVVSLYYIIVIYIPFTVYSEFFIAYVSFEGYSSKAIRRIYIGVVEGCLYCSCAVIYCHIVHTWRDESGGAVAECDV